MTPWLQPLLETLFLLAGAVGSFILAGVVPYIEVTIRKTKPDWIQVSPLEASAEARPRHPLLYKGGFVLLGISFLGQIAFVWLRSYGWQ